MYLHIFISIIHRMHGDDNINKYARPSEKTDMYSYSIVSWEILSEQKPFPTIASPVELSVQVT